MLLFGMYAAAARESGWLEARHIKTINAGQVVNLGPTANSSCRKQNSFVTNRWP